MAYGSHSFRARPRPVAWLLLTGLMMGALGCGYTLVGRGTNLPEDVQEVYLETFQNRTQRQQVDQFVTEAIAEELVKRRRFRLVGSADQADARLDGAIDAFGLTPISFDNQGRATEYEIAITARVALRRLPGDDVVLWKNDSYLFRETYKVDTGEAGFLDLEEEAIREALGRFAETMVSDLLAGF